MSARRKPVQVPPDSPATLPATLASACEFLRSKLVAGSLPAKQLKAEGHAAGRSWATMRRAQQILGVESYREGGFGKAGTWHWRLNTKVLNDASAESKAVVIEHVRQPDTAPSVAVAPPGPRQPTIADFMVRNDYAEAKAPGTMRAPLWMIMGRRGRG